MANLCLGFCFCCRCDVSPVCVTVTSAPANCDNLLDPQLYFVVSRIELHYLNSVLVRARVKQTKKTWTLHTLRSLKYLRTGFGRLLSHKRNVNEFADKIFWILCCKALVLCYTLIAAHGHFFSSYSSSSFSFWKKNKKFITFLSPMFSFLWHWHHTLCGKYFFFCLYRLLYWFVVAAVHLVEFWLSFVIWHNTTSFRRWFLFGMCVWLLFSFIFITILLCAF